METRISKYVNQGFTENEARQKVREDFARIGAKGGKVSSTGGFAANHELARIAGAKGGTISRRKPKKV